MNENDQSPGSLLSVADVGELLNLSDQRVRQLIASGTLEATKVGRAWVIDSRALESVRHITSTSSIPSTTASPAGGKIKALSFFSGAMGLDLGLERAGITTMLACEFDRWARQTIATNRSDIPVLGDIWRYTADDIRKEAGLTESDTIDVIAGGPPCQAFSTAGSRRGFEDARGNVFLYYLKVVSELRPRYVVIENVRGILSMPLADSQAAELYTATGVDYSHKHGVIRLVFDELTKAGYTVTFNLYNAANYGAPQIRERVVIIGTLDEQPVPYLNPTHHEHAEFGLKPWVTFRQAVQGLDEDDAEFIAFPEKRLRFFKMLESGQYWKHLPEELHPEAMGKSLHLGGGKTGFYRRLAWDRPAPTLVTHPAMPATDLGHPSRDRPLSVQEYKRLQQFPDDWDIQGTLVQRYKQIGNAVPLGLGEAIGRALVAHAEGTPVFPPEGFRFSRYTKTSDAVLVDPGGCPPNNTSGALHLF